MAYLREAASAKAREREGVKGKFQIYLDRNYDIIIKQISKIYTRIRSF
jgi:transcriptional regulator